MLAEAPREPPGAGGRFDCATRNRPVPSAESASDFPTAGRSGVEEILAVTDQTATQSSLSSPPTRYYPSPAASVAGGPGPPANPGDVRTGPYGRAGQNPRVRLSSGGLPGPLLSQFCVDTTH